MRHPARFASYSQPIVPGPLALESLWLEVCQMRGTPAPDSQNRLTFLKNLDEPARLRLYDGLVLACRGQEHPGGLLLLSWATSCTRPALLSRLGEFELHFLSADLFSCSLALIDAGWDMSARLAGLADHSEDVDTLRAVISEHALNKLKEAVGGADAPEPEPGIGDYSGFAGAPTEPLIERHHSAPPANATPLPDLPTRFTRESHEEVAANVAIPSSNASAGVKPQQLRLYGKKAAHTLEITPHRRGEDFLGIHVVTIDSAHALPGGGGCDWKNKLVLQLTPEEMPGIIATLIGITASVKFGQHGADRSKYIEVRRQEGGIVLVTGDHGVNFPVPVPTAIVYYLVDLFCRAMAMSSPGRPVSDILALVKSAHGY